MNRPSHILMGCFLQQYMEDHYGIHLNRNSFILGNVMPDYFPSFLIRPHFLKKNASHVQRMIKVLLKRRRSSFCGRKYSRLLGILCHYYTDFFCYAHSDSFEGNLSDHIQYEKSLYLYFVENLKQFQTLHFIVQPESTFCAGDVYRQFETLHSCYLRSQTSFGNDLLFAMTGCVELIVMAAECTAPSEAYHFENIAAV